MQSSAIACCLEEGSSMRDAIWSSNSFVIQVLAETQRYGHATPLITISIERMRSVY